MKANKDKGTSVGFSKVTPESYDGKRFEGNSDEPLRFAKPNPVCKEHEWVWVGSSKEGIDDEDRTLDLRCQFCKVKKPTDFKISENIEVINKQEWEDILNEYYNSKENTKPSGLYWEVFYSWLKENYLAPEKKIT